MLRKLRAGAITMLALLSPVLATTAHAVTFTVQTTADAPDARPDGRCAARLPAVRIGLGPPLRCTLRAALQEAGRLPRADVSVPEGRYRVDRPLLLTLTSSRATVIVSGAGRDITRIDGGRRTPVLVIRGPGPATGLVKLQFLSIERGRVSGAAATARASTPRSAGGIWTDFPLMLQLVRLQDNLARPPAGARSVPSSLAALSSVAVYDTLVDGGFGDSALYVGGGGLIDRTAVIRSRRSSAADGRNSVVVVDGPALRIANSTLEEGDIVGRVIDSRQRDVVPGVDLDHVTIRGTRELLRVRDLTPDASGVARLGPSAPMRVRDSILVGTCFAGSFGSAPPGTLVVSQGGNVGTSPTCVAGGPGDLVVPDAGLGELEFAGSVPMFAPQPGSPALGHAIGCTEYDGLGRFRPATGCDSGAVEVG